MVLVNDLLLLLLSAAANIGKTAMEDSLCDATKLLTLCLQSMRLDGLFLFMRFVLRVLILAESHCRIRGEINVTFVLKNIRGKKYCVVQQGYFRGQWIDLRYWSARHSHQTTSLHASWDDEAVDCTP